MVDIGSNVIHFGLVNIVPASGKCISTFAAVICYSSAIIDGMESNWTK